VAEPANRLKALAQKSPLPEGTFAVGAGLAVAGVATYLFQSFAGRTLSKADYAALNSLWVLSYVLAPGFFLPLEQEVARALGHRRAIGQGGAPLIKRAAILGFGMTFGLVAVILATFPLLKSTFFHGNGLLVVSLIIAMVAFYAQSLAKGVLSGNGRFGGYGLIMGSEAVARMIPAAIFLALAFKAPGWFGVEFALAAAVSVVIGLRGQHGLLKPGPAAPWSELSSALGLLLIGSVLTQLVGYAAFLGVELVKSSAQSGAAGDFAQGFFTARIPILLFQAVQAALLPKLAELLGAGKSVEFKSGLKRLLLIVVGVGLLGVLGSFALGPFAGKILFGNKFVLSRSDLTVLALGNAFFIVALTLAQASIAMKAYARVAVAWGSGLAVIAGALALSKSGAHNNHALFLRAEIAFTLGSALVVVVMGALLWHRMSQGIPVGAGANLIEGIEHEPLEI
jgi:O-antigen/teichoic acid export membrane protein